MIGLIKQFIKFTITGTFCFSIDFGIMVLLKECFNVYYLIAAGISFVLATMTNFIISVKWVYDVEDRTTKAKRFIPFLVLSAIGLFINILLMWCFTDEFNVNYMISKVIVGIIVSFYNFITRKIYLEKRRK